MPAQRLTMRRVRELLRLHDGMEASARAIARELGVSRSTVKDYLARATAAGLTWPLADEITDGVLEERLFAASGAKPGARRRAEPDWAALVREIKRPGVNLTLLWEEYGAAHSDGYQLQPLLRALPRFRTPAVADHAAASRGRRQGVRRLFRQDGADRRPTDGRDPPGAALCRRARRLELHARHKRCPSGSASMFRCSRFSRAAPGSSSPTISNRASTSRHFMIRRSIAATPRWRCITGSASCRPDPASRVTKPKSRRVSALPSPTCSAGCDLVARISWAGGLGRVA
jgi:hypothetical protein